MSAEPSPGALASSWRADLRADLARYRQDTWLPSIWWLTERTVWAVAAYRLGQGVLAVEHPVLRAVLRALYAPMLLAVQIMTSIEIWPHTSIGPGLRIYHGTGIVISPSAVLGANVVLRQGVTIGSRRPGLRVAPTIGDNVTIGAYAQLLGEIRVGNNVRVGASSVVLTDVPAGATVTGVAAQIRTASESHA